MNRRQMLIALGGLAATRPALAAEGLYPLVSDAGVPIMNERMPSDLYPYDLPGVITVGSSSPDVVLIEFFDYNCPTCRGAVSQLDEVVRADPNLQLRIFNNAILSAVSLDAAKTQQAVLRAYGPQVAYRFHKRLLAIRGIADRESALDTARGLGLDMAPILAGVDMPRVASVVAAQMERARNLDLTVTPSFVVGSTEILGWPGPKELVSMVRSIRACDKPICGANDESAQSASGG